MTTDPKEPIRIMAEAIQNLQQAAERVALALSQFAEQFWDAVKDLEVGSCPNGCLTGYHIDPAGRCPKCDAPMAFETVEAFVRRSGPDQGAT